ncbi:hypothetical protein DPM19_20480 [Actinomadura craniellae]|uniref:DUF4097 domain-containing protein n=1 Tax=Actinomadura craniellae TaxID=2231787 RepID=A0A365H2V8_9ACTN|nr:DUF4097 family beta strand repeat-containing protein [Actinomadura craniellae]RAY13440.1 hypothetical protein DPM19_20480 [Actinomadura craniellae]
MAQWTIDEPTTLGFDGVVALKATLVAGGVSVLAGDGPPSLEITEVAGPPLVVAHEAGMLSVTHQNLSPDGLLKWLREQLAEGVGAGRAVITVTVPHDCPVQLNLGAADAVVTGLTARTSIRSAAGDITLDGVTGRIDASTVSGDVAAQGLAGAVGFTSVSGDLAVAGGSVDKLTARTVSGRISADIDLVGAGQVQVHTVSGEVALRLPESASADVDLNSAAGEIDTSFPRLEPVERPLLKGVAGRLGTGSGRLSVTTVSGGVTLLSRPADPPRAEMEEH